MDRKLLAVERIHKRDKPGKPADGENLCKEQKEEEKLVKILAETMSHYFPEFNEWLKEISDPRDQEAIVFDRETQIWTGIILFLTKRGARKKISDEMRTKEFCENLKALSGQSDLERVAHGDTVNYAYMRFKEEEFEILPVKMMRRFLRVRALEKYRLLGRYYTIAIDATGVYSFDYKHCEQCLMREDKKGNKKWYHFKLQASIVTWDGLCLPMASEWIENGGKFSKQDCELRAFYRLIEKLRRLYRQLPMCILLDGLYAGEPQFKALEKERMEWIVVFKEGAMPEVFNWTMKWKAEQGIENVLVKKERKEIGVRNKRTHQERLMRNKPGHQTRVVDRERIYTWMQGIKHWNNQRRYNLLTCKEKEDGQINCDYTWLVSNGVLLCRETVEELSEKGGRCRWKQENEGFNTQKNGGYGLEHCYCRDPSAMKIWNRVLEIAYFISQLITRGSLVAKEFYGSVINIAHRMFEHFRYFVFKKPAIRRRMQIRLGWNSS